MNKDIMICGVGGQGTVLASKIIAAAAITEGSSVHSAETIGMAQRGGSVTSHIRVGSDVYSPLIPLANADIIIAFEPSEAVRNLSYLKSDGIVISNTAPTKPVTESLHETGYDGVRETEYLKSKCECIFIDGVKACEPYGSMKFLNIILLGVAVGSQKLGVSAETVLGEIERRVPARFVETNKKAFLEGCRMGGTDR